MLLGLGIFIGFILGAAVTAFVMERSASRAVERHPGSYAPGVSAQLGDTGQDAAIHTSIRNNMNNPSGLGGGQ